MKLRIAIGLGVAAICLPAVALAGTTDYKGKMDRGGVVRMKIEKNGSKRRVVRFRGRHHKADCNEGTIPIYGGFARPGVPVADDGTFELDASSGGNTLRIVGRVESREKVTGTFEEHLDEATSDGVDYTDCNTGVLNWKAKRQ
jgi:hypothetical protein